MRYLATNQVDHDVVHPSRGGRSNSLAPSRRFGKSNGAAFEATCMAIRGWPRCRARTAVGAATAPSVFAPSCDGARTDGAAAAATLTGPPRQDDRRVRLIVLFRSTPYWPSESTHKPNARVSTAFTYTYMRCRSSNSRHCCCPRMAAVGPSTP